LIVEKEPRLGGKIISHSDEDFLVEGGPDSFLAQKPWAMALCRELGLEGQLIGTNDASRKVFILWQGHFRRLPEGISLVVPTRMRPFLFSDLFTPLGKLRMGLDLIIPSRRETTDESVANFIRRRLGAEALDRLADPLMGGVHTSNPEQQSLLGTFPAFAETERKYGSLIRGMLTAKRARAKSKPVPLFMTLRGGLERLVETVVSNLGSGCRVCNQAATRVRKAPTGGYLLDLEDQTVLSVDAVVLAVPASAAAALVKDLDRDLAHQLKLIRFASTVTVSLGYRRRELGQPVIGSGFLIPRKEGRRINACTWSSEKFPGRAPSDSVLLRCFLDSDTDKDAEVVSADEGARIAREELRELMGIDAQPVMTRIHRWVGAHPQYDVGHLDRVAMLECLCSKHRALYLTGSSYRGVGIPDCVHDGERTATTIINNLLVHGERS
jgi:oxygen-dependent protoporphyrinogen oxidase